MKSGKTIPSNNVIWAAGVTGNVVDGFPQEKLIKTDILQTDTIK